MVGVAEFICRLDWISDARVYELNLPYTYVDEWNNVEKTVEYVIVSAVVVGGESETLIFPARKFITPMSPYVKTRDGRTIRISSEGYEAIDMLEIAGKRGTLCHEELLEDLGYEVR